MEQKVLEACVLYRYLLLGVSTIVYLFVTPESLTVMRLVVAAGMIAASVLGARIYRAPAPTGIWGHQITAISIEIIAYGLFILLSGGFSSPYLWYSLCSLTIIMAFDISKVITIASVVWCFICALGGKYLGIEKMRGTYLAVNVGIGFIMIAGGAYALLSYAGRLAKSQRELETLQDILGEYMVADEQNRIAGEIHDTVIQKLFVIACRLHLMSSQMADVPEYQRPLEDICSCVESTMKELREAIYGFRWTQEEASFQSRLKQYMDEMACLSGVDIQMSLDGGAERMTPAQKTTFYRVFCEAVNNAVKHAGASNISLGLYQQGERIHGFIRNDGSGFKALVRKRPGNGLQNMRKVVQMLDGEMEIQSRNGETMITINLPR